MQTRRIRRIACGAALLVAAAAVNAGAAVITQWTFENQPISGAPPYNNSPTPSTGSGTASSIGMDTTNGTPNVGVTSDDILAGVSGDTGTNTEADTGQIWRVRAQAGSNGPSNGWSSLNGIGTQGAVFAVPTTGFNAINVSFDWYATKQGEAKMQLEYSTNGGSSWTNTAINIGSNTQISALTNSADPNTVNGSYVFGSPTGQGQNWFQGLTATISDPLAADNPNFEIEMVNAATGTSCVSMAGTALNNNSGNWRFDNITIGGTALPEPASLSFLVLGACGLAARRRRRSA